MGMYAISPADALFTRGQQRVLGALFLEPDTSFLVTELIARTGGGTGAVHRELARLTASGIVSVTQLGGQRRYQAARESPIFAELRGLILKTGVVDPLKRLLVPLGIRTAFIYGREECESKLMIIADVSSDELSEALGEAEAVIGRPIESTYFSLREWQEQMQRDENLLARVRALPKLFVIGTEDSLT